MTPLPQPGNPRPRLFRLEPDQAVINRLGFNSEGAAAVLARLAARASAGGIVGVNVGANKDSSDRTADYVRLIEPSRRSRATSRSTSRRRTRRACATCSSASALDDLLARVVEARDRVAPRAGPTPVLLKIAPDLSLGRARRHRRRRARAQDRRHDRRQHHDRPAAELARRATAKQAGGLSGRPLFRWRPACWRRPMCGPRARSR